MVLCGELDLHGVDQVRSVAAALLDDGIRRLDVDAAELAFVDSSGLMALLDIRHDALARNIEVTIVSASPRLRWVGGRGDRRRRPAADPG